MGDALDGLEHDYDNFRAVLHWSLHDGEISVGLRLAGALYRFWMLRGHLAEARQWLERALPAAKTSPSTFAPERSTPRGVVAGIQGDNSAAQAAFEESFRLWQAVGEPVPMAAAMGNLGLVAQDRHDMARASRLFPAGGGALRSRGRSPRDRGLAR